MVALLCGHPTLFDITRQAFGNPLRASLDKFVRGVEQDYPMTGAEHDMRNPVAHLTRADNSDSLDFHKSLFPAMTPAELIPRVRQEQSEAVAPRLSGNSRGPAKQRALHLLPRPYQAVE
jgi:hypothetical protein